ncbi:helix-turn-helix domain-containing protein [Sporohalobacter salinus]|uniref:helix-turn-helix domain-containing protein n=1 Tax=Sporohalobacter salinus TaxID=1494606 RepID=UPI00195FBF04|nr:transcriptional regulator with XRE-family HTH domain [Sporohalobacter salinus]
MRDARKELVKKELQRKGWSQKKLAQEMGYSESVVSQYLNGTKPPEEFYSLATQVLGSIRLKLVLKGDTTAPVYFEGVRLDLFFTMDKLEQECRETIEAIRKAKGRLHNVQHKNDCTKEQSKAVYRVLEKGKDLNHCVEHMDIVGDDSGFDLEKRDRKCLRKYYDNKYLPTVIDFDDIKKDTCSGKASVSV